jgi:hypothetical protein
VVTSQIQDQGAKWANLSAEELVFHVSIGYSVLRPYAERSSFPGQRRTASADLESDREIFSSRPEREITIDSASFPAPEPKEAVSSWRDRSHNKRDRFGIPQTGSRFSFTVF